MKNPTGKEILGHAFKSCLAKNKFLSENGNNFQCSVCYVVGHNMCISGANDSVFKEFDSSFCEMQIH